MTRYLFRTMIAVVALFWGVSVQGCAANSSGLFRDFTGDTVNVKLSSAPTVVRSRLVSVNFDQIQVVGSPDPSTAAPSLNLNLFPGASFVAVLDRVEKNPSGSYSWIGHLEGRPDSSVTLVVNGKIMMGNISAGRDHYAVRFASEPEIHVIQEIDPSKFPRD